MYYKNDLVKEYYENGTVFFESDRRNNLQVAVKLEDLLESDLEMKAERNGYDVPVWMGPHTNAWGMLDFNFVTERLIKQYFQEHKVDL